MISEYSKKRITAYIEGVYDFVDVRDVVEGHILAWKKGKKGELYILSEEKISVRELFSIFEKYTGVRAPKMQISPPIAKLLSYLVIPYYKITGKRPYLPLMLLMSLCPIQI